MDFGGKAGPGPGDYEPYRDIQMKAENMNAAPAEEQQRFEAHLPRYHEIIVKDSEKRVRFLNCSFSSFLFFF